MRSSKLFALFAVAAFATACSSGSNANNQMSADTTAPAAAPAPAPADTGMPAAGDTMHTDTTNMTTTSSMD